MNRITREQIREKALEQGWTIRATVPGNAPPATGRSDIFYRAGVRVVVQYRYRPGEGYTGPVDKLYRDGWTQTGRDKAAQALDLLNKPGPGGSLKSEGPALPNTGGT